jgi:uncharacterized membrane protein
MSDTDHSARPARRANLSEGPSQTPPQAPAPSSSFEFNHPTIISLLYLSSVILGVTAIVGVVLAYVWKGEAHAEWETSHYEYLIRTFWIALVGGVVSMVLMIVLIGFLLLFAVFVLVVVRCVLSLVNAQKREPMPNPQSLFV